MITNSDHDVIFQLACAVPLNLLAQAQPILCHITLPDVGIYVCLLQSFKKSGSEMLQAGCRQAVHRTVSASAEVRRHASSQVS